MTVPAQSAGSCSYAWHQTQRHFVSRWDLATDYRLDGLIQHSNQLDCSKRSKAIWDGILQGHAEVCTTSHISSARACGSHIGLNSKFTSCRTWILNPRNNWNILGAMCLLLVMTINCSHPLLGKGYWAIEPKTLLSGLRVLFLWGKWYLLCLYFLEINQFNIPLYLSM